MSVKVVFVFFKGISITQLQDLKTQFYNLMMKKKKKNLFKNVPERK